MYQFPVLPNFFFAMIFVANKIQSNYFVALDFNLKCYELKTLKIHWFKTRRSVHNFPTAAEDIKTFCCVVDNKIKKLKKF